MGDAGIEAYPLCWPAGRERTISLLRKRSKFDTTFATARDELLHELKLLGAAQVVLSTNVALRRDGLPLASQKQPTDPGVAVYFQRKGRSFAFACDRWLRVEDNIWAICKTVNALRGIERWGTGQMVEAAFTGFERIAPPKPGWWVILEVKAHASTQEIETSYRRLAMRYHPDRGGNAEVMASINAAYEQFKRERGI